MNRPHRPDNSLLIKVSFNFLDFAQISDFTVILRHQSKSNLKIKQPPETHAVKGLTYISSMQLLITVI